MSDVMQVAARYNFNVVGLIGLSRALEKLEGIAKASESVSKALGTLGRVAVDTADSGAKSFTLMRDNVASVAAAADKSTVALRRMRAAAAAGSGGGSGGGARGGGGIGAAGGAAAGAGASRFLGGAGTIAGLSAVAGLYEGVRGAANLQDASIQLAQAMGVSLDFVTSNLQPLALKISTQTAQSITDSMGILRGLATAGINDPKQLQALALPIARYADAAYLGKNHTPFDQSIATMAQMSHMLNIRDASGMTRFADSAYKASLSMPDPLSQAATQLRMYGARYVQAGISPEHAMMLATEADRMGYGKGRSGSGFRALLDTSLNPSKIQFAAQHALGLIDATGGSKFIDRRTGGFAVDNLFDALNGDYNVARKNGTVRQFEQYAARAFGVQGGTIATALSSNAGLAQRKAVIANFLKLNDVQTAQIKLMSSLNNQFKVLITNTQSLATIIAGPLVAPLTDLTRNLATVVGGLAVFFNQHPTGSKVAAGGALAIAGTLGLDAIAMLFGGAKFAITRKAIELLGDGLAWVARSSGLAKIGFGGIASLLSKIPLLGFARGLGLLASRFVPVAGWILLAVEAFKLLADHSKQLNYALNYAAAWITLVGGPMLVKAVQDAWSAAWDYLKTVLPQLGGFIWDSIRNSFIPGSGGQHTGIQGATKRLQDNYGHWNLGNKHAGNAAWDDVRRSLHPLDKTREVGDIHIHGPINLHGVKDPKSFVAALRVAVKNAGGAPVSAIYPAALSLGMGFGN